MAASIATANEQGTLIISLAFTDENGAAVTPNSVTWTLQAPDGTVINGHTAETETPATTITIVLTGDDLVIGDNGKTRYLRAYGTYDSATYGAGLNYQHESVFEIADVITLDD